MTPKTQNVGEGSKKCRCLRMCLNLNDYQFKTSTYSSKLTYMKLMVTRNLKLTIDTQKLQRKEHKHITKENYPTTSEETKRTTEKN